MVKDSIVFAFQQKLLGYHDDYTVQSCLQVSILNLLKQRLRAVLMLTNDEIRNDISDVCSDDGMDKYW